ncbi:hypothetical protein ACBJ59_10410 [Nonomuraea sp. MTCD27]|uniref:hypothetical protein n=1 Tax=Nonomuraea sp. MTCD27 TaxID=1676747 RepID=UPI0035BEDE34
MTYVTAYRYAQTLITAGADRDFLTVRANRYDDDMEYGAAQAFRDVADIHATHPTEALAEATP